MIKAGPAARLPGLRILRNLHAALESDALECFRFVEPSPDNREVYSVELLEIQGRACAAIDSAFHIWYDELKIGTNPSPNLPEYFSLRDKLNLRFDITLELQHRPEFLVSPFLDWNDSSKVPAWWTAHNRAKHALSAQTFRLANLHNALSALGGLYIALNDAETRGTYPLPTRVFVPVW